MKLTPISLAGLGRPPVALPTPSFSYDCFMVVLFFLAANILLVQIDFVRYIANILKPNFKNNLFIIIFGLCFAIILFTWRAARPPGVFTQWW